ncbi:hypothetical protein LTR17_010391 [Elasticomyces elasticus]|nr:hypothetical protein LTR17_010391 [Elasticomyces elasticus]
MDTARKEDMTDSSADSKLVCGVCGTEPSAGGTLLRCTRCKSVWYCGKDCQQEDWNLHKIACKKMASPRWPDGAAAMVELQPDTRNAATRYPAVLLLLLHHPNAPSHDPTSLSNYACQEAFLKGGNLSDRNKFKELPLSNALGYPLVVSTDPDPVSPRFGLPTLEIPVGDLVLVRRDGKHMHKNHVIALVDYARTQIGEVLGVTEREDNGERANRKEIADRLLTPAAFARAFEDFKQKFLAEGRPGWQGLECPVDVV